MKIIVSESQFEMFINAMTESALNEARYISNNSRRYSMDSDGKVYGDYLGNRPSSERNFASIDQTNDIVNFKDMGRSTPEQREKWKMMGRRPNKDYYQNEKHMWAHIRHLQNPQVYGNRISFFSYDNGNYIFYALTDQKTGTTKKGYLKPNDPMGYEKLKGDPMR